MTQGQDVSETTGMSGTMMQSARPSSLEGTTASSERRDGGLREAGGQREAPLSDWPEAGRCREAGSPLGGAGRTHHRRSHPRARLWPPRKTTHHYTII